MADKDELDAASHNANSSIGQGVPSATSSITDKSPADSLSALLPSARRFPTSHPDSIESSSASVFPEAQSASAHPSSSSAPTKQLVSTSEVSGPSPYGTRSRNRTGTARINYAEDREIEGDYSEPSKRPQAAVDSTELGPTQPDNNMGVSTRRSSSAANASMTQKAGTLTGPPKDFIPGMSTFSLHGDGDSIPEAPSKKRKAPGGVPAATSVPSASARLTTQAATRKYGTAAALIDRPRETNMLSFESCQAYLRNGKLKADDGTVLGINDHVYCICEPAGEPYYLGRIMEFLHCKNDIKLPIEFLRVNWYYRPRDIQRNISDTRLVYASFHSQTQALTNLRGKCRIMHRSEIGDLDEYRKSKDCFWYEKMYDRYMKRYYEVIPTVQVINVPERVKKVLDERWKFVLMEAGRGKDLTSAVKSCKRCSGYCASANSVDCAMCRNTYHMNCVRPPLLKKPARGFAWSCGPCSRKQERKLEARNTPIVSDRLAEGEEEEYLEEEEEEDHCGASDPMLASSPMDPKFQSLGAVPATAEQIAQVKLWPYRYLGIHCRVEDVLDYDTSIYPRAVSRLGPRHQANVMMWHGRPVELIKPAEIKKKYMKGSGYKKDAKLSKDTIAALEADKIAREKRPKWVVDEPLGYVHRGDHHPNTPTANTSRLLFRLPQIGDASTRGSDDTPNCSNGKSQLDDREALIDDYMFRAKGLAKNFGLKEWSTNFLDKALETLCNNSYAVDISLDQLRHLDKKKDLKEPDLSKEELRRFEEGVAKYGSELGNISRHVGKSQKHANIVRFYYMWKKTERGSKIWLAYNDRYLKKQAKEAEKIQDKSKQGDLKLVDDVADDVDDSAFDNDKAVSLKRGFQCKFCTTRKSRQWRRPPNTVPGTTFQADPTSKNSKDKGQLLTPALCQRCAGLWRKYGIQWENIDEVAKKVAQGGGRASKKRVDEELLRELFDANEANSIGISSAAAAAAASVGLEVSPALTIQLENPKKKQKTGSDVASGMNGAPEHAKKKVIEKPPEPPLIPEQPRIKMLPCAVCNEQESSAEGLLCCRACRLTVHRDCYGIAKHRSGNKWMCDMCSNDSNNKFSTSYDCVLCPVRHTEYELMEPPRVSHKKKNDKERDKERLERELIHQETEKYHRRQEELGRPIGPREPLKRTAANNWVHVVCAIWTPEIKFANARTLEPSEGIPNIPVEKYEKECKVCKSRGGACVSCHQCSAVFHVACAQQSEYTMGFDVTPVKSSRRNTVTLGGEVGNAVPVIYCKEHTVRSVVHPMNLPVEKEGHNALQLYSQRYKQADLSSTGTMRKANLINSMRATTPSTFSGLTGGAQAGANSAPAISRRSSRVSTAALTIQSEEVDEEGDRVVHLNAVAVTEPISKDCVTCGTGVSPKWHNIIPKLETKRRSPGADESSDHHSSSNQLHLIQSNSHVNSEVSNGREDHSDHAMLPPPEDAANQNNHNFESRLLGTAIATVSVTQSEYTSTTSSGLNTVHSEVPVAFQCHKCHLIKGYELPMPQGNCSTQPTSQSQLENAIVPDSPSSVQHVRPAPPNVSHQSQYPEWPSQAPAQANGHIQMGNGISQTPSHVAPHVPRRYTAPRQQCTVNGYGQHSPTRIQAQHPPTYPQQQSVDQRPISYPGPPQHYSSTQHPCYMSPPQHAHSPRLHHQAHLSFQSPAIGSESTYSGSYRSQTSPRPVYRGPHDSPHGIRERPETPTEGIGRGAGWPVNENPMMNGASASPSVRNLLS